MLQRFPFVSSALASMALSALMPIAAAGQSPRPLIAFGDSITSGLGDTAVDCAVPATFAGYPSRLRSALASRGITTALSNLGICGETTSEALSRIDGIVEGARDVGLLMLMEGTNDISAGVGIESIAFNLGEMARRGAEYRLEPVYASVIPRSPKAGSDSNNARTFGLGERLAERAAAEGRFFVNAFQALADQPDLFETLYSDPFHPNAEGYDVLAAAFVDPTAEAFARVGQPGSGPCAVNATRLCLNEGRFEIIVDWQKPDGERGIGLAEQLTADTGYFYFFRDTNIELVVKVLDGRNNNGHFWVFFGALSNVQYTLTVRDTETGTVKRYINPPATFGSVGDTRAFEVAGSASAAALHAVTPPQAGADTGASQRGTPAKMTVCVADAETLCLNEARFKVSVTWRKPNGQTGTGTAVPRTPDTGMFYFFRESNIELILKVLDGRTINGHFWVFYGALSNVEYRITVTDTATGREKIYINPQGTFASVGDTRAFETPPGG